MVGSSPDEGQVSNDFRGNRATLQTGKGPQECLEEVHSQLELLTSDRSTPVSQGVSAFILSHVVLHGLTSASDSLCCDNAAFGVWCGAGTSGASWQTSLASPWPSLKSLLFCGSVEAASTLGL